MSGHREPLRVAIAGCGAVGGALAQWLTAAPHAHGRPIELVRVLVRSPERERPLRLAHGVLTSDPDAFLHTRADVVIETIGGVEAAEAIARHVLSRGGQFITANKALVAARGPSLLDLAHASGGSLRFEAAVGGGVPIVRMLRETLAGQPIRSIRGILNGTANFILTRLEAGDTFAAALASARARGFAEADPSRDLDGRDVADKIAILAWIAWGVPPDQLVVTRQGLPSDPMAAVQAAAARGERLRLVGECRWENGQVSAGVRTEAVGSESPLGRTIAEQNYVEVDLGWAAPLTLSGPGAGGVPTAGALWSDLLALGVAA